MGVLSLRSLRSGYWSTLMVDSAHSRRGAFPLLVNPRSWLLLHGIGWWRKVSQTA